MPKAGGPLEQRWGKVRRWGGWGPCAEAGVSTKVQGVGGAAELMAGGAGRRAAGCQDQWPEASGSRRRAGAGAGPEVPARSRVRLPGCQRWKGAPGVGRRRGTLT